MTLPGRHRTARRAPSPRIVAGALYAVAVVATAFIAAWPIYRSWRLTLLAGVCVLVAAIVAAIAHRRRWAPWRTALVLAGATLVLGVPLAVPARLGSPLEILAGLGELGAGLVLAWKDLLTVDLPVGDYRNLLVPAFVVFLVGTCVLLLLAWRADRVAYAAVPVALAMASFGLFFGRDQVSATLRVAGIAWPAPVETLLGVAVLVTNLLWLAWRAHDDRVRALRRAADASGVRVSRRRSATDRRRTALGAGLVAASVLVAVAVVPAAAGDASRTVLRSAVGPEIDLSAAPSPLSQYRALFAADRAEEVLFTVEAGAAAPDRVRLATLDAYDGEVFRVGGDGAIDDGRFRRVAASLDAGSGERAELRVDIEGLRGIWMPTAGALESVRFFGDRAASLSDGFYYRAAAAAGVQTAAGGLDAGDSYRLSAVVAPAPALATIEPPGSARADVAPPESLTEWVERHATGSGGAALAALVDLLRERGYLSHGLDDGPAGEAWIAALGGDYRFEPSASGHSLARIDAMFQRLLEREADPRAEASGNYVAAVGDDEQFATAVALIARELGFPSRVVLGARLSADPGLPACEDGVCRARDMAAWTEVLAANGTWVAVDATPQYAQSPSLELTEQRDPENVTEVRPDVVEEILPPDPVQEDSAARDDLADAGIDWSWVWPVARIALIVLLAFALVIGPFLAVVALKAARRRDRRTAATAAERIVGGWEEYVDAAADAGRRLPRSLTRSETAAAIGTQHGDQLARLADRAAFGGPAADLADDDAVEHWRQVDLDRRALTRGRGVWRALLAAVSLKSFLRSVVPVAGARRPVAERGTRPGSQPVRSTP